MLELRTHKTIVLKEKKTKARTQYYEVSMQDEEYLYYWIELFLAEMGEILTHSEELRKELFRPRKKTFPTGILGHNSVMSFAGGMLANKLRNPENDISKPQLNGILFLFEVIGQNYTGMQDGEQDECLPVKFDIIK